LALTSDGTRLSSKTLELGLFVFGLPFRSYRFSGVLVGLRNHNVAKVSKVRLYGVLLVPPAADGQDVFFPKPL
jgi:hypothetical protein